VSSSDQALDELMSSDEDDVQLVKQREDSDQATEKKTPSAPTPSTLTKFLPLKAESAATLPTQVQYFELNGQPTTRAKLPQLPEGVVLKASPRPVHFFSNLAMLTISFRLSIRNALGAVRWPSRKQSR
jgi:hypothetical protein